MKVEDKVVGFADTTFLCSFHTGQGKDNGSDYPLRKSTLLDSGTTIDIFNDLSRFRNFRKAPRNHVVRCGNHFARILGYGTVDVEVTHDNRCSILRIQNAAFCPDFMTNLVSFTNLRKQEIF